MILLDTHVWIWWVHGDPLLPPDYRAYVQAHQSNGLGVCAITCWEVAKLVALGRLSLPCPVDQWLRQSLGYPNVQLLPLSPEVAVESSRLPGTFHRDPADQLIVATGRIYGCPVVTLDQKIRAYSHGMVAP